MEEKYRVHPDSRRANLAHIRQSRPVSGLVFQVKFLKTFLAVPSEVVGDRTAPFGREVRRTKAPCVPSRAPYESLYNSIWHKLVE